MNRTPNLLRKVRWRNLLGAFFVFVLIIALLPACSYRLIRHGELNTVQYEKIREKVSAERQLKWIKPVEVKVIDRHEVRAMLEEQLNKEYPPEKMEAISRAYVRMGLIDSGTDLRESFLRFLTSAGAGFYDSDKKTLFIVKEVAGHFSLSAFITQKDTAGELVIAHELGHALDDQNFDFHKLEEATHDNDDASLALSALQEGSATVVGFAVLYGKKLTMEQLFEFVFNFNSLNSKLLGMASPSTPSSIRDMLLFSYDGGSRFVAYTYKNYGGWEGVNKAFRDPPHSTEQVLHPKKYFSPRDLPRIPAMPVTAEAIGKDWVAVEQNTLGEFGVDALFKRFFRKKEGVPTAEGWGGDRYIVAESPDKKRNVWVWRTAWDDEEAAKKFAATYQTLLSRKYETLRPLKTDDGAQLWETQQSGLVYMRHAGREVDIIEGADQEQLSRIVKILNGSSASHMAIYLPVAVNLIPLVVTYNDGNKHGQINQVLERRSKREPCYGQVPSKGKHETRSPLFHPPRYRESPKGIGG